MTNCTFLTFIGVPSRDTAYFLQKCVIVPQVELLFYLVSHALDVTLFLGQP